MGSPMVNRIGNETYPKVRSQPRDVDRKVIWGLFWLSMLIRVFFVLVSDNEDGDSFARVLLSRVVVDEGRWIPTEVWLPIHSWILSIPYGLGLKSQLWPRLLTAVAGAGTVPFTYLLMARLFDRRAALAGAVILALNPLHIRFSVVTVSEAFLVFFSTVGLWGFTEWVSQGRYRYLASGALAMNLACGNRMEAWLLVGALLGVALMGGNLARSGFKAEARTRGISFGVVSSMFAVGWMIFSYIQYGDALHIATLNTERVKADVVYQSSTGWYTMVFWPVVLGASLGPVGFLTGIRGATQAVLRGPGRYAGVIFLSFVGIYYAQNFRSGMITDARYALFLQSLFLLSAGPALRQWGARARRGQWIGLALSWLVGVWLLSGLPLGILSTKMRSVSPCPRVASEARQINRWLKGQPMPPVIALGPGLGRYGPWYSLLDDWYPRDRVVVIKSEEAFVRLVGGNGSGYIILGKRTPSEAELLIRALPGVTLRQLRSGSDFEAYGWGG